MTGINKINGLCHRLPMTAILKYTENHYLSLHHYNVIIIYSRKFATKENDQKVVNISKKSNQAAIMRNKIYILLWRLGCFFNITIYVYI